MTPTSEHSEYHSRKPLLRDLQYHLDRGYPVMDNREETEDSEEA